MVKRRTVRLKKRVRRRQTRMKGGVTVCGACYKKITTERAPDKRKIYRCMKPCWQAGSTCLPQGAVTHYERCLYSDCPHDPSKPNPGLVAGHPSQGIEGEPEEEPEGELVNGV